VVVTVHGPELARGAGFRLLRAVLLAAGLAALAWLLLALFGSSTAAADDAPSDGLVNGVVNGLTGGVSASSTSVAAKPVAAVAPATVSAESVAAVPAKAATPPAAPVATPAATAPKPAAKSSVKRTPRPAAHARQPVAKPKPVPVVAAAMSKVDPENQVNRPGREPAPVKAPLAPSGSVTAGHDGPGTARGLHGTLPLTSVAKQPAVVLTTSPAARDVAGRSAGLPLTSPD
jgi:hypothetical protein